MTASSQGGEESPSTNPIARWVKAEAANDRPDMASMEGHVPFYDRKPRESATETILARANG